jgi:hypothetical protein
MKNIITLLFLLCGSIIKAQSDESSIYKFKAFETTSYTKAEKTNDDLEWSKTDILVVVNLEKDKVFTYGKREKNIDLIKDKGSYTDENGDYWINYTGVDEDGDKCGVSLKIFKKSESYNSHIATLFIEYADFKLVFRLKKDD